MKIEKSFVLPDQCHIAAILVGSLPFEQTLFSLNGGLTCREDGPDIARNTELQICDGVTSLDNLIRFHPKSYRSSSSAIVELLTGAKLPERILFQGIYNYRNRIVARAAQMLAENFLLKNYTGQLFFHFGHQNGDYFETFAHSGFYVGKFRDDDPDERRLYLDFDQEHADKFRPFLEGCATLNLVELVQTS